MALGRELLLAGVIAGGTVVGVGVGVATSSADSVAVLASVPTYDCPDGATAGDLHSGDRVLATGRDDSGQWLEVRAPRDQGARVWVEARYVTPDGETAGLDVRSCDELGTVALAPTAPAETTTTTKPAAPGAPGAPPTTKPSGGGTPTSTVPVDTTGPTITSASVTPTEIYETDPSTGCSEQATVAATATDPSGVASITASWAFGAVNQTLNVPATFGPFSYQTIPVNTSQTVTITITAQDTRGNVSTTSVQVVLRSAGLCLI